MQGKILIVAFIAMAVMLAAIDAYGGKHARVPERHPLWELGEYLFPILGAVIAGAGFFARYPGILESSSPPDATPRAYFALSLLFLWSGVVCFSWRHACFRPNLVTVLITFAISSIAVVQVRTREERAAGGWLARTVVAFATIAGVSAVGLAIYFADDMFSAHICLG